jgi:hypothetical protein
MEMAGGHALHPEMQLEKVSHCPPKISPYLDAPLSPSKSKMFTKFTNKHNGGGLRRHVGFSLTPELCDASFSSPCKKPVTLDPCSLAVNMC